MSFIKKSSALSVTAAVLTFHSALILPNYAYARGFGGAPVSPTAVTTTDAAPVNALATVGPGVTVTQASANAPVVVTGLTAAQEATMANTLAAWGGATTSTSPAPSVSQQVTSAISVAASVVATPLAAAPISTAPIQQAAATSATSSVAPAITSTVTAAATSEAATISAWGSYNPMTGTPGTSTYAPPAGTVVTPATANPLASQDNGSNLSPSMQAGIAASLATSLANFNPVTYVADSPMAKQTTLIGMLNTGNYSGAFTYAKANGLLPNLESAAGLQQLSSPLDQDSLDFTTLPAVNPFTQSQMEAYYAAAQAAIQNGTLGTGPIEGNCVSGNSNGTINVGCAVTDTATQSNYMWIPPTAAEADANAAHSTLPNLLGFSAAGQQLPSGDPLALTLIIGVFVGVATAGIGEVVGDAVAAGAGVASSAATTVVGSAIVGAADGAVTAAAEGGNIGKGALGGLFAGALGGAAQASGVTGDISSGLQNIGVNSTVANIGAGIATSTGTGTILNGGNVVAAAEGAAENGGISAAEGALSDTSTNSAGTIDSNSAANSDAATGAALAASQLNNNPFSISNATTTASIAGAGLQTSGFSFDGTSAAIAQDTELDPVVTTAQTTPVHTTDAGSVLFPGQNLYAANNMGPDTTGSVSGSAVSSNIIPEGYNPFADTSAITTEAASSTDITTASVISDICGGTCGARATALNNILSGQDVLPITNTAANPYIYNTSDLLNQYGNLENFTNPTDAIDFMKTAAPGDTFMVSGFSDGSNVGHVINGQVMPDGTVQFRDPAFPGHYSTTSLSEAFTPTIGSDLTGISVVNSTTSNPLQFTFGGEPISYSNLIASDSSILNGASSFDSGMNAEVSLSADGTTVIKTMTSSNPIEAANTITSAVTDLSKFIPEVTPMSTDGAGHIFQTYLGDGEGENGLFDFDNLPSSVRATAQQNMDAMIADAHNVMGPQWNSGNPLDLKQPISVTGSADNAFFHIDTTPDNFMFNADGTIQAWFDPIYYGNDADITKFIGLATGTATDTSTVATSVGGTATTTTSTVAVDTGTTAAVDGAITGAAAKIAAGVADGANVVALAYVGASAINDHGLDMGPNGATASLAQDTQEISTVLDDVRANGTVLSAAQQDALANTILRANGAQMSIDYSTSALGTGTSWVENMVNTYLTTPANQVITWVNNHSGQVGINYGGGNERGGGGHINPY